MKKTINKVGAVIYDIKNNKPYFLLLHRILHWSGWENLKETIENNETAIEALKRGIKEETQLKNFEIMRDLHEQEKWEDEENEYSIIATYLVKADMSEKIFLKQEIVEHDNYKWLERKEAIDQLTWPAAKDLIKKVIIGDGN